MLYYKVKPEADNKQYHYTKTKTTIYVGGELYTPAEVKRYNLNPAYLELVDVNRRSVYFCFGARFAQ